MVKVEIPKTEYEQLKKQAEAYRRFTAKFFESIIRDPIDQVVEDFRKTNLYTEEFLRDLETGLRKSSYLKRYGNKTPPYFLFSMEGPKYFRLQNITGRVEF